MASALNELMNLDPEELTSDPDKLQALIEIYRQQRQSFQAGVKPKKDKAEKAYVPMTDLLSALAKPDQPKTRRPK